MDIECKVLENWRVCRSALTAVIRNYLSACADLRLACSKIQCPLGTRREVEPVQLAIDAELASLASEESDLAKARFSLSVIRNTSSTLAPVHTLPPEILARIFLIAPYPFHYIGDGSDIGPAHTFTQVSSYWRSTAINLPYLWTHIRITPAQINYKYATLFLRRSNDLPIYLDICGDQEVVEQWDDYPAQLQWEEFLVTASPRVHTLNVYDSFRLPETLLYEIIGLLLSHGSAGATKALRIKRPESEELGNLERLLPASQFVDVLHSVTVLHLDDVIIPWTSTVYHNLVDLRLEYAIPEEGETSMLQLANILTASPGLATLKLEEMMITLSDNWNAENIVRLAHLELLYLKGLTYDSLVALPLILSLSDCPGTLEVGIYYCRGDPLEISRQVQDFLHGVRIKTLGTSLLGIDGDSQWILSLSKRIPSLENLILLNCNLLHLRGSEGVVEELEANTIAPSCLPHLFLVSSNLDFGRLKSIVSVYGVETLHLDGPCSLCGLNSGSKAELKTALLESFPSLKCVISDEDTTLHWPCRRVPD